MLYIGSVHEWWTCGILTERRSAELANITLKGLAISTYGTIQGFADAMGWSYRKASYILSGRQEPTASDIELMAEKMEIDVPDIFRQIFFAH